MLSVRSILNLLPILVFIREYFCWKWVQCTVCRKCTGDLCGGRELLFMKIIKERTSKVELRLGVMAKTILSYVLMLLTWKKETLLYYYNNTFFQSVPGNFTRDLKYGPSLQSRCDDQGQYSRYRWKNSYYCIYS